MMKKSLFILLTALLLPFFTWSQIGDILLDGPPPENQEEALPPPPPPVEWEDGESDFDVIEIREPGFGQMCTTLADYKAKHPIQLGLKFELPEIPDELPGFCPDEMAILEIEPGPVNLPEVKNSINYPAAYKDAGLEGKVIVRVRVDEEGNTTHCLILKNPHDALTKEVVTKVFDLRWTPGKIGDEGVACWVALPFDFRLRK